MVDDPAQSVNSVATSLAGMLGCPEFLLSLMPELVATAVRTARLLPKLMGPEFEFPLRLALSCLNPCISGKTPSAPSIAASSCSIANSARMDRLPPESDHPFPINRPRSDHRNAVVVIQRAVARDIAPIPVAVIAIFRSVAQRVLREARDIFAEPGISTTATVAGTDCSPNRRNRRSPALRKTPCR